MLSAVPSRCWTTVGLFWALGVRDHGPASYSRFLSITRSATAPPRTAGGGLLITGLAERGVDLKAIAEIAGHTSIRTTAMYVEFKPEAARADIAGRDF